MNVTFWTHICWRIVMFAVDLSSWIISLDTFILSSQQFSFDFSFCLLYVVRLSSFVMRSVKTRQMSPNSLWRKSKQHFYEVLNLIRCVTKPTVDFETLYFCRDIITVEVKSYAFDLFYRFFAISIIPNKHPALISAFHNFGSIQDRKKVDTFLERV